MKIRQFLKIAIALGLNMNLISCQTAMTDDNYLDCGSYLDKERAVMKRNKVMNRKEFVIKKYDYDAEKLKLYAEKNNIMVMDEFDRNGNIISKRFWYVLNKKELQKINPFKVNEPARHILYEYDSRGRIMKLTYPKTGRTTTNHYASDTDCETIYNLIYSKEKKLTDSIAYFYDGNKRTSLHYSFERSFLNTAELVDSTTSFLGKYNVVTEDKIHKKDYQFNDQGLIISFSSTNKLTGEKIEVVYEYKNELMIKSFEYKNCELVEVTEIQYEYY